MGRVVFPGPDGPLLRAEPGPLRMVRDHLKTNKLTSKAHGSYKMGQCLTE